MEADKPPSTTRERTSEFLREVWSLVLVKVGAAEEESSRVLQKAAEVAGWGEEEARRLAKELVERLGSQRREYERSIEEGIRRAIGRLKVPRREELEGLGARLDRIEERIAALYPRRDA
ncbi:MAG: phasin family protein [Myxococcales bacterium]|jgi:polyhydroxyalkanoate synthesis regulator phasin